MGVVAYLRDATDPRGSAAGAAQVVVYASKPSPQVSKEMKASTRCKTIKYVLAVFIIFGLCSGMQLLRGNPVASIMRNSVKSVIRGLPL